MLNDTAINTELYEDYTVYYDPKTDTWYLNVSKLIKIVAENGECYRIHGDMVKALDECMKRLLSIDKDGYDDGYSKDPDANLVIKLNGIDFEDFLNKYAPENLRRKSGGIFDSNHSYEYDTDFEARTYKDDRWRELEAKNCKNMNTFAGTRVHKLLYAIVNDRENKTFHLLCKLGKNNVDEGAKTYKTASCSFKEIKDWYWLKDARANYEKEGMANSWKINRGVDELGCYIEFISPRYFVKRG